MHGQHPHNNCCHTANTSSPTRPCPHCRRPATASSICTVPLPALLAPLPHLPPPVLDTRPPAPPSTCSRSSGPSQHPLTVLYCTPAFNPNTTSLPPPAPAPRAGRPAARASARGCAPPAAPGSAPGSCRRGQSAPAAWRGQQVNDWRANCEAESDRDRVANSLWPGEHEGLLQGMPPSTAASAPLQPGWPSRTWVRGMGVAVMCRTCGAGEALASSRPRCSTPNLRSRGKREQCEVFATDQTTAGQLPFSCPTAPGEPGIAFFLFLQSPSPSNKRSAQLTCAARPPRPAPAA